MSGSAGVAAGGTPVGVSSVPGGSGMDNKELMTAMKGVGQAIKLDTSGKSREAYLHYLSCIQFISQVLLEDARQKASTGSAMQSTTSNKMLKLVQQCTERSAALFQTIDESQTVVLFPQPVSTAASATSPITQHQTSTAVVTTASLTYPSSDVSHTNNSLAPTIPATTHHVNVLQPQTTPPSSGGATPDHPNVGATSGYMFPPVPSLSPVRVPGQQGVYPGNVSPTYSGRAQVTARSPTATARSPTAIAHSPTATVCSPTAIGSSARKSQASPLEVAYRENKKLMAAYRARLARIQSKKNRAAMSLTLQRRLMENMAIAKVREAALSKKIQERQQRLQEEAVRRFSSSGEPTVHELELRHVFASSMEFENHVNWLQEYRLKLQQSPHNIQLIHELISLILSCKEHPLAQQLQRYQFAVYKLIYPLISKDTERLYQNCVPYHNVDPLKLSAGVEPRIIPTDGFMTPDDPSKTMDEDLMKRLQALRESAEPHGTRLSPSTGHVSSQSAGSVYDEEFEDLLSDDALVDDVIATEGEEESRETKGDKRGIHDTNIVMEDGDVKEADCTTRDDNAIGVRDLTSSGEDRISAEEFKTNSTDAICQEEVDDNLKSDDLDVEDDVDDVVNAMRDELKEAIVEGEKLEQDLTEQVRRDTDIGRGKTQCEANLEVDNEDDIDRRSSADSGVQEDRMDGDESSGTHSAISPVIEVGPSHLRVPCVVSDETESENADVGRPEGAPEGDVSVERTKCEESCNVDEDIESNSVIAERTESDKDHTVEASSEDVVRTNVTPERTDGDDDHNLKDAAEPDDESSSKKTDCTDVEPEPSVDSRTLDQNANEDGDDDVAGEPSEKPDTSNATSKSAGIITELELSDRELVGDIDGALDESEEERIIRLKEEALARHLNTISADIHTYIDKILSMLVAVYDELDSTLAKEQCTSVIEDHFFKVIWQPLFTLFRRVSVTKEATAAIAMTKYQYAAPEHIGVIKKLCLTQQEGSVHNSGGDNYPYWQAVQELRKVTQYYTPLDKLECIVRSSRMIIQCVGDYHESLGEPRHNSETSVGCDDLLPILSYVIIKSALPQIVSECSTMEEFIHEGYLFGEEGYCLTTLQTALGYVLKLAND